MSINSIKFRPVKNVSQLENLHFEFDYKSPAVAPLQLHYVYKYEYYNAIPVCWHQFSRHVTFALELVCEWTLIIKLSGKQA